MFFLKLLHYCEEMNCKYRIQSLDIIQQKGKYIIIHHSTDCVLQNVVIDNHDAANEIFDRPLYLI